MARVECLACSRPLAPDEKTCPQCGMQRLGPGGPIRPVPALLLAGSLLVAVAAGGWVQRLTHRTAPAPAAEADPPVEARVEKAPRAASPRPIRGPATSAGPEAGAPGDPLPDALKIVFERRSPLQNDPEGRTYLELITKYIDLRNNRMRTEVAPAGQWAGRTEARVEIEDSRKVYEVHPSEARVLSEKAREREGPVWTHPPLDRYVGEEEVAGRTCKCYNNTGNWTVCLWRGIPLKESVGGTVREALSVEPDPVLEASLFDADSMPRVRSKSGDAQDLCRLDRRNGNNITRYAHLTREACLAKLCDIFGPANAGAGTESKCLFDGTVVKSYSAGAAGLREAEGTLRLAK